MKIIKRILPVISITLVVILMSQILYNTMLNREKERCRQDLSSSAATIKDEITTKFMEEISKLHLVESLILEENAFNTEDLLSLHIDTVLKGTFFSRIDIILPDNTLVSNGIEVRQNAGMPFDEIVKKGEYLTPRATDLRTQKLYVYYILPIIKENDISAVLIGGIDLSTLSDMFQPEIYDGKANICIIDANDGNYIIDSWHNALSNAYEMGEREFLKGYNQDDFFDDLRNLNEGSIAFKSRTTGNPIYFYYMPICIFDWQLCIFAEDMVIFENMFAMRKLFIFVEIFEILMLILYFLWNLSTVKQLEKSNSEIKRKEEQLQILSYHDALTNMFNRNKYEEVCAEWQNGELRCIGAAYIDMNGLKRINDLEMHEAGDRYICSTANVIMSFFPNESYRIGGDEFVILSLDISLEEFTDKANKMFDEMSDKRLSVSYGLCWKDSCYDLEELLQKVEKDMYKDKQQYYKAKNVTR